MYTSRPTLRVTRYTSVPRATDFGRERGGTGYALEAAMHDSGNLVFVAGAPVELCMLLEATLIWEWREHLSYNNLGKRIVPLHSVELEHAGEVPALA